MAREHALKPLISSKDPRRQLGSWFPSASSNVTVAQQSQNYHRHDHGGERPKPPPLLVGSNTYALSFWPLLLLNSLGAWVYLASFFMSLRESGGGGGVGEWGGGAMLP